MLIAVHWEPDADPQNMMYCQRWRDGQKRNIQYVPIFLGQRSATQKIPQRFVAPMNGRQINDSTESASRFCDDEVNES
jgi:hypothetical protein